MILGRDEALHSRHAIGERLKLLREKEGLNQSQMSRELGIERANWNNWELGRVTPPIDQVWKLLQIFGVTSDWVYFGVTSSLSDEARKRLYSRRR